MTDTGAVAREDIVGREREMEAIAATLDAGRDLLLEGPPGTSKSTLLRAVARSSGRPFELVEGSADLTPTKLVGYHNPSEVIRNGYRPEDFIPGPLLRMMRDGGLLYIEEFNRVPEDTLNVILGPLAERSLVFPRVGTVGAASGFRIVAAMNPFDNVGTLRVSQSVLDRLCRLVVGYQTRDEEREVVRLRTACRNAWLIEGAVSLVRATRNHQEVEAGSSVRGAIDIVLVAERLGALRGVSMRANSIRAASKEAKEVVLDAARISLSSRITPYEISGRTPEEIVHELWEDVFYFTPQRAEGGRFLALENAVSVPGGRPRSKRRVGAVISSPKLLSDRSVFPKPGKPREEPRVYEPNEMALLASDRGSGPVPRKIADIRRDNPEASEIVSADGDLDPEALHDLYERDEEAAVRLIGDLEPVAADRDLRRLTRRLALKIVLRLARKTPVVKPGRGKLRSVRYRFDSDDLDLDRTLEEIAGVPYPEYSDFWVTERVRTRRAYALLLDVSGSMRGEKLIHVALAAASLSRSITEDDLAVVLFWRDAAIVKGLGEEKSLSKLLDDILAAKARGLTNLRFGLEVGLKELDRSAAAEKEAIIFTDGLYNIGDDPLPIVERYPKLHVIGISLEERRVRACRDLAYRGRGRCSFVERLEDIPRAVNHCLTGG